VRSCAVRRSPASWSSPGGTAGAGEPVHTGGVVPGSVATCSLGVHPLNARAGTANIAATVTGLNMVGSLTCDRDDDAGRLLRQLRSAGLDGSVEQLTHFIGCLLLAWGVAEEHRGDLHTLEFHVTDIGHVPLGLPEPVGRRRGGPGDIG